MCLLCVLTGVGAVIFGPVQTSILAHLEKEALPAEQPGHYALQLWFYMQRNTNDTSDTVIHISKEFEPTSAGLGL